MERLLELWVVSDSILALNGRGSRCSDKNNGVAMTTTNAPTEVLVEFRIYCSSAFYSLPIHDMLKQAEIWGEIPLSLRASALCSRSPSRAPSIVMATVLSSPSFPLVSRGCLGVAPQVVCMYFDKVSASPSFNPTTSFTPYIVCVRVLETAFFKWCIDVEISWLVTEG